MDNEEARSLRLAHTINKQSRRNAILFGIVGAIVFMVLQAIVVVGAARVVYGNQNALADRVDRNLAYTICILSTPPTDRTTADYVRCFEEVTALYPHLNPPLPSPPLID